jgi:hypothetical protein
LLLEHFFAQGQHAKRDELAVEIFARRKNLVKRVVLNALGRTNRVPNFLRQRYISRNYLARSAPRIIFRTGRSTSVLKSVRAGKIRVMRLRLQGLARLRSPR